MEKVKKKNFARTRWKGCMERRRTGAVGKRSSISKKGVGQEGVYTRGGERLVETRSTVTVMGWKRGGYCSDGREGKEEGTKGRREGKEWRKILKKLKWMKGKEGGWEDGKMEEKF